MRKGCDAVIGDAPAISAPDARAEREARPRAIALDPALIPEPLRDRPQWVCWKYIWRDEKWTKFPCNPLTGQGADSTGPATWVTFAQAMAACGADSEYDGPGFVFSAADGFAGIDLDECIDENGQLVPAARAIVDQFNSYTEVSPSGTGVKIFIRGLKPEGSGCKSRKIEGFKETEIYDHGRYFTVTGQHLAGTPHTVEFRQPELEELCRRLWPSGTGHDDPDQTARPVAPVGLDDVMLIERVSMAKNGAKFNALWSGDTSQHGGDDSAADLALCSYLAFWTGGDTARMDRLFRQSGLYRPKWDERRGDRTYGQMTIECAIAGCADALSHETGNARPEAALPSAGEHTADGGDSTADSSISSLTTDVGNAARLVRRYRDRIRYCYGPGHWLIWDGKRWKPDERGRIVKLCKATALSIFDEAKEAEGDRQKKLIGWAMASQRRDRLTAMAALAQPEVAVGPDDLDADPWAFNVLNGTIDLRTGELRPHRRDDLIAKIAPVEYDAGATAPRFERFLDEIFGGDIDLIRFVKRWQGHCLSADIREQYLLIYCGEGNNGKSVLLDTISAVMGDYAGEAPPDLVTIRKHPEHPTEIADLMGRRLVIASETERDAELRLQLIKRLTGNARLKARLMRQDFFEFARTHKMILVTNNRPSIKEDTEAAWRRLRLVPFDVVISKGQRDAELMRKLIGEQSGILTWLVQGCVDWLRDGLTEPNAVMVATEAYRGSANSLEAFLLDRCVIGDGLICVTTELMASYADWCAQNQRVPIRGRAFAAALKERKCIPRKIGGQRHWIGLALDEASSGQNGRNGRELPIERRIAPHEGVNGNFASNPSNVSTGGDDYLVEQHVNGCVSDG